MILVDTNVVSETMRAAPAAKVVEWLDVQAAETLFLATVSLAELLYGIAALPQGRRKSVLAGALAEQAALLFGDRILSFDVLAANSYAVVVSRARNAGHPIGMADGQIAAIATVRQFAVATRDVGPFEAAGLRVINPWTAAK